MFTILELEIWPSWPAPFDGELNIKAVIIDSACLDRDSKLGILHVHRKLFLKNNQILGVYFLCLK